MRVTASAWRRRAWIEAQPAANEAATERAKGSSGMAWLCDRTGWQGRDGRSGHGRAGHCVPARPFFGNDGGRSDGARLRRLVEPPELDPGQGGHGEADHDVRAHGIPG